MPVALCFITFVVCNILVRQVSTVSGSNVCDEFILLAFVNFQKYLITTYICNRFSEGILLKENSLEQISCLSWRKRFSVLCCTGAARPQKPESHCPRKPVFCAAL